MKFLLSFSIGAILGDVFFHLIPESYQSHVIELNDSVETARKNVGISIIAGMFMFIIGEMILEKWSKPICGDKEDLVVQSTTETQRHISTTKPENNNNDTITNLNDIASSAKIIPELDFINNNTSYSDDQILIHRKHQLLDSCTKKTLVTNASVLSSIKNETKLTKAVRKLSTGNVINTCHQIIDPAGYLSLIANGFDNFTHGLAIGASFLVGPKVGLLTTFVIFIHEIPHEICDYAILVNSGFTRWDALKAQSSVSLLCTLGTVTALYVKSVETLTAKTVWILPFSAGGFLYIALVNLLPEILDRQTNVRNTIKQVVCVIVGIAFMGAVAIL